MHQVGITDPSDYVDYLEVHPAEFEPLFNTILINVTSFFRDEEMWAVLRERVIPALVARDPAVASGCGAPAAPAARRRTPPSCSSPRRWGWTQPGIGSRCTPPTSTTRRWSRPAGGAFSTAELKAIPEHLLATYFTVDGDVAVFSSELRRSVIFGRHDLLQDAPISRVDLLLCRNTLMYLNTATQAQVIDRLHFSLADHGVLVLGRVESLLGHRDLFRPVDAKLRVFEKVPRHTVRSRLLAIAPAATQDPREDELIHLVDSAFEHGTDASILLEASGLVIGINARARSAFSLSNDVVGRPFQDLEVSYRPVELRSAIDRAWADRLPVELGRGGALRARW
jgi:two-component system, chemotaxis family, CheB/CheR fusion protein